MVNAPQLLFIEVLIMKVLGIVGSPRKGGNTVILVKEALAAAKEAGAETEIPVPTNEFRNDPGLELRRSHFKAAGLIPNECHSAILIQFYSRSEAFPFSVQGMGQPDGILTRRSVHLEVFDLRGSHL
jgi:hypothetical protein